MRVLKNKLLHFFKYIVAIALILECRSIWTAVVSKIKWFSNFLLLILVIGIIGIILCNEEVKRHDVDRISLHKFYYFVSY